MIERNMRSYPCVCHVCGATFDHESQFMSVGHSRIMPDGTERLIVTCNVENPRTHTGAEIRAGYARLIGG